MLWSSFGDSGYAMGIARSVTGTVEGPWEQETEPIWGADGGHGMITRTLDGSLLLTLHQPNDTPHERTVLRRLREQDGTVRLAGACYRRRPRSPVGACPQAAGRGTEMGGASGREEGVKHV